jgi:hypothetical protein
MLQTADNNRKSRRRIPANDKTHTHTHIHTHTLVSHSLSPVHGLPRSIDAVAQSTPVKPTSKRTMFARPSRRTNDKFDATSQETNEQQILRQQSQRMSYQDRRRTRSPLRTNRYQNTTIQRVLLFIASLPTQQRSEKTNKTKRNEKQSLIIIIYVASAARCGAIRQRIAAVGRDTFDRREMKQTVDE